MKKCILSAIGGALAMLIALIIIANVSAAKEQTQEKKEYEHIDFISTITQDDCFVCGNSTKDPMSLHWGCLLYTSPSPRDRG